MKGRAKLARRALVFVLAMCCTGALAAGAIAATLHISAKPTTVHANGPVKVTVSGSFKKSELSAKKHAYVFVFVEKNAAPCKGGAVAEQNAVGKPFLTGNLVKSPFKHSTTFPHVNVLGKHRFCAYLYGSLNTHSLLKRATSVFNIVHGRLRLAF